MQKKKKISGTRATRTRAGRAARGAEKVRILDEEVSCLALRGEEVPWLRITWPGNV